MKFSNRDRINSLNKNEINILLDHVKAASAQHRRKLNNSCVTNMLERYDKLDYHRNNNDN